MKKAIIAIAFFGAIFSDSALAQPIADQDTKVVREGSTYRIEGGTIADRNLFHSFEAFSVPEGTKVLFNNGVEIQNIFSRVTGEFISEIDGAIATQGQANLFLLNPNGIILGNKAQLNIGGSFFATTAENLVFDEVKTDSALLTVSVPIGLQFGETPGNIVNTGQLSNNNGKIALIGGNLELQGGVVFSNQGIDLGSVGNNSFVGFADGNFDYSQVENFGDITLEAGDMALFPAIAIGSKITLTGKDIAIADGRQIIVSEILNITSDSLTIRGSGTSSRAGVPVFSGLVSATFGGSDGGDIAINTGRLILAEGGLISSEVSGQFDPNTQQISFATGNGGDITIKATELIDLSDQAKINSSTEGFGNAGNIKLETSELIVSEGAKITVDALLSLGGAAGNLIIQANSINLEQGIITAETNTGDKGNIAISNVESLSLRQSKIATDAIKTATGGNINIEAEGIALIESSITAKAVQGRGGNINIKTQGLLQDSSSIIDASSEENIDGEITITDPDVDPTSSIIELPNQPIDSATTLTQSLCEFEDEKIAKGSSFIITGRGGLTPTSEEALDNINNVVGWARSNDGTVLMRQRSQDKTSTIQQAQGWVTTSDGSVWLVPKCSK